MAALHRTRLVFALLLTVAAASEAAAQGASIQRVRELSASAPGTRVTVRGTVTRARPGRSLSVQDPSGSIFAYTEQNDPLAPGDLVEVTGETGLDTEHAPSINHARYRKFGSGPPPAPVPAAIGDLDAGRYDAALVSLEALVERVEAARFEYSLLLVSGESEFNAWVLRESAGSAAAIAPGSRVAITGVVSRTNQPDGHDGFELLLRSGADVTVLEGPPWWRSRHVPTIAAMLAGASLVLLSYAFLLRRQVRRQTAIIAERLRAEAELQEQFRQARKMESVGRLAGGIAHDFNNIMTVVLGHAEVLGLELKGHPELMESVDEIRRASERASAVTRQLLAFGRRQRLERAPVDLNDVVTAMATLLRRVLGGDIEVRATPANEPVIVTIDRAQLEQALLNLAVNARDAMPAGGALTLSVSAASREDRRVAVLRVTDTGSGIPADVRPHIFDPFFTTKEVGRGSGLGLAMVYGFVQQTGGSIGFETADAAGTTFELTFPLTA